MTERRYPKAKGETRESISFSLPATSANLGAAFDAAALALNLHLHVTAQPAREFSITAVGREAEICARTDDSLLLDVYRATLRDAGVAVVPLALQLRNEIPIGKGCGSSAAARLAGLMLAVGLGGLDWPTERIVAEAASLEGHTDNAAACWFGGLIFTKSSPRDPDSALHTVSVPLAQRWPLLLVVPRSSLKTEAARAVLPAGYPREDAVSNVQSALFLAAAFSYGRPELLRLAFDDRLHQPYREALCPLLPALRPLMGSEGIAGVALSGSGPAVLVVLEQPDDRREAEAAIQRRLDAAGLEAEIISTEIALQGARASFLAAGGGAGR